MELKQGRLRTISLMAVATGFFSFIVGSSVIALFGYTYTQPNNSMFNSMFGPMRNGITPAYWAGTSIIIFGIFSFIGGIIGTILFLWKYYH